MQYISFFFFCFAGNEKLEGIQSAPLLRHQKVENLQRCVTYLGQRGVDTQGLQATGKPGTMSWKYMCSIFSPESNYLSSPITLAILFVLCIFWLEICLEDSQVVRVSVSQTLKVYLVTTACCYICYNYYSRSDLIVMWAIDWQLRHHGCVYCISPLSLKRTLYSHSTLHGSI